MTIQWLEQIKAGYSNKILKTRESVPGEWEITCKPGSVKEILTRLKSVEGGAFVHLSDMTGYDEHPKTPRFYVVYQLISMKLKQRAAIVVPLESSDNPTVETVTDLWPGANWLERETFDMLGIKFEGHPDHRRILLPNSFVGFPLRKDFIVDYRQKFPEPANQEEVFDPFGNTILTQGVGKES